MRIRGSRSYGRAQVFADGKELKPDQSQQVWNHSPDGFEWGYGGSGPSQLALAILLHAGLPAETAVAKHHELKFEVIARLGYDFEIDIDFNPSDDPPWKVNSLESPVGRPATTGGRQ